MDRRQKIVLIVFASTPVLVIGYTIYLIKTLDSSESIELLFLPLFAAGGLLFIESIVLSLVFVKHLKKLWSLLLPAFLISSPVPIWTLDKWVESLPAKIPKAGVLPVSLQEYENLKEIIIADYKSKDIDTVGYEIHSKTKILKVDIDTIIYSPDTSKFFSILINTSSIDDKTKFSTGYRVGIKQGAAWKLAEPSAGIWSVDFNSMPEFKNEIRQYYYKRYSINGSSNKPEIWKDYYLFEFSFIRS